MPDVATATQEEAVSEHAESIEELFSIFKDKFLKIMIEQVNSMEILAVLVLIECLLQHELNRQQSALNKSAESDQNPSPIQKIDHSAFVFQATLELPKPVFEVLSSAKLLLLDKMEQFIVEQVNWIVSGKGGLSDAKMLGLFPAICKFPVFLDTIEELSGHQVKIHEFAPPNFTQLLLY